MITLISLKIEEQWFNKTIRSEQLPQIWSKMTFSYLNQKPTHHMEATLRPIYWIDQNIGVPFVKLAGICSVFNHGLIQPQYQHPFFSLLQHFRKHKLSSWEPAYNLLPEDYCKNDQLKLFIIFQKKLYQSANF